MTIDIFDHSTHYFYGFLLKSSEELLFGGRLSRYREANFDNRVLISSDQNCTPQVRNHAMDEILDWLGENVCNLWTVHRYFATKYELGFSSVEEAILFKIACSAIPGVIVQ